MTARRGSLAISGTDKASRTCTCLGRGGRRAAHVCGLRPLADCSLCLCRHGATARACNAAPPASRTGLARLENFSCAVREGYYLCEEPQKVGLDPRVRRGKEWRGVKAAQGESRTRRRWTRPAWVADSAAAGLISPRWLLLYSPVTLSVLLHHDRWVGTAIGGEPSPEGGLQGSRCFLLSK